ncbi:MAG: class I SAM-dependent methyltransferase [Promethearchaeota archaeon]
MKSEYWDRRFSMGGKIWGDSPSKTAEYACELFLKNKVQKILIPGAGYGRNSKLFSNQGFDVTGIEISGKACEIAKEYDLKTNFFKGSFLDMSFDIDQYDAIYCHNTLHLFLKSNRILFVKRCYDQLKNDGFVFFSMFSEKEKTFGKGKEFEKNTFESKPGRPVHYFSKKDLITHFKDFLIIKTGLMKEKENHGELGLHTHILRFIFAQKRNKIKDLKIKLK